MGESWKAGGATSTDSASIALPGQKLATSKNPRMLSQSEIDLLRQDLNAALRVVGQDEIDDAEGLLLEHGFRANDFEILQKSEPSTASPGPIAGTVQVLRKSSGTARVYDAGSGSSWIGQLEKDLKSGLFGSAPQRKATANRQSSAKELIHEAIRKRALLEFHYHGRLRVVAPYCYGVSTRGVEVLRAIQVRGLSASGGLGFGKLWAVAKMINPRLLDETFVPEDPNYNPNDSGMTQIYCCL